MTTKFVVDNQGNYIGSFVDSNIPGGSIEVPNPPSDARQVWDFDEEEWGPIPPPEWMDLDSFLGLIPDVRQNEIINDSINAGIFGYVLKFVSKLANHGVRFTSQETIISLGFLLQQGIITQEEHDKLMTGQSL